MSTHRADEYWQSILDLVDEHGWAVTVVFGGEDDQGGLTPSFSYTVGLSAKGLPDLLIFGLPEQSAHPILNAIVRKAFDGQIALRDGQVVREAANLPLKLRVIEPAEKGLETALGARRFAAENGHEAQILQVLWPDLAGTFPDEPGCDAQMTWMQNINRSPVPPSKLH